MMLEWFVNLLKDRPTGSMGVAKYMEYCLYHPEFGYYTTRNPLGRNSDFLTAPETSQMFGEMIALCFQELWLRMGEPRVHIIEVGPGQGTLMQDFLRIIPMKFRQGIDLHLMDVSPVLMAEQKKRIQHPHTQWHDSLESALAACKGPTFIIANELFDAMPIQQLVKTEAGWKDRLVALSEDKARLIFIPEGDTIKEVCPLAQIYMEQMSSHVCEYGGMGLIIDYGYVGPALGDTLQAIHQHQYHDVLNDPGMADITAHVDFRALIAKAGESVVHGPTTQGDFLSELGIHLRAEMLKKTASLEQGEQIDRALYRLTDSSMMGELFKVMAITGPQTPRPLGFSKCLKALSLAS
jgi:NADH dehydrogenase [ubiquinone] 1 alpha subcomplex assembly factor 7